MGKRETLESVKKYIKRTNWYRQGGAVFAYYPSPGFRAVFISLFDGLTFYRQGTHYGYFNKDVQRKAAYKLIKYQERDKKFIDNKLLKSWRKEIGEVNNYAKFITAQTLAKLNDRELVEVHRKYDKKREKSWTIGGVIEFFDPWGANIVREAQQKYKKEISADDLAILMGPPRLPYTQTELLSRLKIAGKFKKDGSIKKDLIDHWKKYYWISNSWYSVRFLTEKYFFAMVKKMAAKPLTEIRQQIRNLEGYQRKNANQVKKILKKHKVPKELERIFYFFAAMTTWRDDRKIQALKENAVSELFLNEFSKRTSINKKYLRYLDSSEVKSIEGLKKMSKELKSRVNGFLYTVDKKGSLQSFVGKTAQSLNLLLEKSLTASKYLRGTVANTGEASGIVKVIRTRDDIKKMKTGHILVTQMTRPDQIVALKKARAIVADEGGITSHAAIISRELNIPCVIATQTATSVLQDGDFVEVDAYKGTVTKLRK